MKQGSIIAARKALMNLYEQEMPYTEAMAIHQLIRKTDDAWDFQVSQEKKVFEKYKPENVEGQWIFSTEEEEKDFWESIRELSEMEVEFGVKPAEIKLTNHNMIKPADIDALQGFVTFKE